MMAVMTPQVHARAKSFTKTELLREISEWQEEITEFEDLTDKDSQVKQDWLYRMQFLIERRYDGSEPSLLRILKFMIELDGTSENKNSSADSVLTQRLVEAIEKIREPNEPLWLFIRDYIDEVSAISPPTIDEYSRLRDYINNYQGVAARRLSPEELEKLLESQDQTKILPTPPIQEVPPVPSPTPEPKAASEVAD